MGRIDEYDFSILVNESERMVREELGRRLEAGDLDGLCSCQDCVLDMATLALNNLKPLYRVSLLGTIYAHAMTEGDYMEGVRAAVEAAIRKIGENPSHE